MVADWENNQLLLCSNDGESIKCLAKNKIIEPCGIFLDSEHDKLYVASYDGKIMKYDYYKLIGEERSVKYLTVVLGMESRLCTD